MKNALTSQFSPDTASLLIGLIEIAVRESAFPGETKGNAGRPRKGSADACV